MTLDIVDDLGHATDDRCSMRFANRATSCYRRRSTILMMALSGEVRRKWGRYHRNAFVTPRREPGLQAALPR